MSTLGFRQVLAELSILDRNGGASFDSGYVSVKLKCSVAEASKRLCRLHAMGFLKRERLKRVCVSKHGKRCRKGFYYEYSLSAQGRKYIRYMNGRRMAEATFYYGFFNEAIPYLDQESRRLITNMAACSELRKFKGSNQSLQTLGLASTIAIPQLTRKLGETITQNLELVTSQIHLKHDNATKANRIKELEMHVELLRKAIEIRDLHIENRDEELQSLSQLLTQQIIFHNKLITVPLTLLDAYKSIVSHLALALAFVNKDASLKILGYYVDKQRPTLLRAEQQLNECKEILQKAAAPPPERQNAVSPFKNNLTAPSLIETAEKRAPIANPRIMRVPELSVPDGSRGKTMEDISRMLDKNRRSGQVVMYPIEPDLPKSRRLTDILPEKTK